VQDSHAPTYIVSPAPAPLAAAPLAAAPLAAALLAAALLAAAALLLGVGLGATDLWTPDEPRYGQIAEELRSFENGVSGLVLLHLGGDPYTQKPPLYYWLAALAGSGSGRVTETAARLPSVLAGVLLVALTLAFARRLFTGPAATGRSAALLSGALLLTTFRFAHLARRAQLDVLLSLFETLALFAFWRIESASRDDRAAKTDTRLVAVLHASLGAAALTKGPVGWLPLLVIVAYLAWERRLGQLRSIVPPWALLLSVAPASLWIAGATWLAPSGFFSEAVVANLFERFFAAPSHLRPFYYYLYQLPADFMPWTLLWPLAVVVAVRAKQRTAPVPRPWRLLIVWVAVPLLVFSLSSGKRGLYLLPVFPAVAMMLGGAIDTWLRDHDALPAWLLHGLFATGAGATLGLAGVAWIGGVEPSLHPGFGISSQTAWMLASITALGLSFGCILRKRHPATIPVGVAIATVLAIELVVFSVVYPAYDAEKSPRPIALEAAARTAPGEAVGIFDVEGLAGGILYYGDRPVEILPRPEHVAEFLAGGGRVIVLEPWKLPWLEAVGPFQIEARARRGTRELVVVSPEGSSQSSP
jgi:4-amino-4-deoxy-L-arabinose transferase-like glycosyltransferase